MQLDLFGVQVDTDPADTIPAPPAHVQGSLFRPDFRAMRQPARRPAPVPLDPTLRDGALL